MVVGECARAIGEGESGTSSDERVCFDSLHSPCLSAITIERSEGTDDLSACGICDRIATASTCGKCADFHMSSLPCCAPNPTSYCHKLLNQNLHHSQHVDRPSCSSSTGPFGGAYVAAQRRLPRSLPLPLKSITIRAKSPKPLLPLDPGSCHASLRVDKSNPVIAWSCACAFDCMLLCRRHKGVCLFCPPHPS